MKIVHILPSFARGGGERLVIELANREAAAGHEVEIVLGHRLPEARTHDPPAAAVRVRHIEGREVAAARRYAAAIPWVWRERRWLAGRDVIHCHLTYGAVVGTLFRLLARFAAPRRRRPIVVETYHAVGMPIPRLHRWLHGRMAARRDALSFMVEDPYWQRFLSKRPRLKGAVIPVGVLEPDLDAIGAEARNAYRASLGIPEGARVVGTIGRFAPERQSHRYADIFAGIAEKCGPDVHFFMGGEGPERPRVEAAIARHGLGRRVHLPGLVRDIDKAFSILDLYITSNVGPVCGVAGLQAIAAGLPTVALQLLEDYSEDEEAWIWSSADPSAVGERAAALLRSRERASALVERQSRHLQQHHSAAAMAAAYEKLYREALASLESN